MAEPAMSNGEGTEAIDTVSLLALEFGLNIDTSWYVIFTQKYYWCRASAYNAFLTPATETTKTV